MRWLLHRKNWANIIKALEYLERLLQIQPDAIHAKSIEKSYFEKIYYINILGIAVKKFLFTLILLLFNSLCTFAEDAITLYDSADFKELVLNDVQHIDNNKIDKKELFETLPEPNTQNFFENSDSLTHQTKDFQRDFSSCKRYL